MNEAPRTTTPLSRRVIAVIVLLIAGWILLHILIGIAVAVAGVILVVVAIAALLWAVNVLF
jgi:hypothetical protein